MGTSKECTHYILATTLDSCAASKIDFEFLRVHRWTTARHVDCDMEHWRWNVEKRAKNSIWNWIKTRIEWHFIEWQFQWIASHLLLPKYIAVAARAIADGSRIALLAPSTCEMCADADGRTFESPIYIKLNPTLVVRMQPSSGCVVFGECCIRVLIHRFPRIRYSRAAHTCVIN